MMKGVGVVTKGEWDGNPSALGHGNCDTQADGAVCRAHRFGDEMDVVMADARRWRRGSIVHGGDLIVS